MAPLLEFDHYTIDRASKLTNWAKAEKTNEQVEYVASSNRSYVDVVLYKDKRQPTVIHHNAPKSFEEGWGRHRVFGEQEVLDDIQEFIGERGVIFDSKAGIIPTEESGIVRMETHAQPAEEIRGE